MALFRCNYGETVEIINTSFPHWFTKKFRDYNETPHNMPVDQHMLIVLQAPRPVYIGSANEDQWADPYGEMLSLYYASPVYKLLTQTEFQNDETMIAVDTTISGIQSYHIRTGPHTTNKFDWVHYLNWIKKYVQKSF